MIADYFIIAGGNNSSQIQALCDNVEEKLGRAGFPARQTEGYETANWVLLDFGDVIVHVFDKENRLLYDLERIWRDGKVMDAEGTERRAVSTSKRVQKLILISVPLSIHFISILRLFRQLTP